MVEKLTDVTHLFTKPVTFMKIPLYRHALIHGWDMATKHKLLWIFGLFAAFLGQMGLLDLVVNTTLVKEEYVFYPLLFDIRELFGVLVQLFENIGLAGSAWIWVVWLMIFFAAAKLLFVFVSTVSQGALIDANAQQGRGRKKKELDTSRAWDKGVSHFWRLLFLNMVKRGVIMLLAAAVGFAMFNVIENGGTGDTALFIVLFVLSMIVGMVLSFLVIYAAGYVVIEEYAFGDACRAAWRLFVDHWLVSLEVSVLMLVANIIVGILAALGLVLFVGEMAIVWAGTLLIGSSVVQQVGFFLGTMLIVLYWAFLGSTLMVFTTSVWMDLFMKMHKKGIKSRVLHFFGMKK